MTVCSLSADERDCAWGVLAVLRLHSSCPEGEEDLHNAKESHSKLFHSNAGED